jgi:hypothetical protein
MSGFNDPTHDTISRHALLVSCMGIPRIVVALILGGWLALPALSVEAAPPTADYMVVFDATWSEETHPGELPPGPHFSGLIGGLHNSQVSFWTVGELASAGIEGMAENGAKFPLDRDVDDAIDAGTANLLLSGGGIGSSPGSVGLAFTAHEDYPLITLVSMLAPSPDWFVGVDSLSLMSGSGWRYQIVVPLYVFDAGTDSGTTFTSFDQDTNPADPIVRFDTGLFAPPKQFVGTFTITRTDVAPPVPLLGSGLAQTLLLIALGGIGAWRARSRTGASLS